MITVKIVHGMQLKMTDTKITSFSNIDGGTKVIPISKRQVHIVSPRSHKKRLNTKHRVLDLMEGVPLLIMRAI